MIHLHYANHLETLIPVLAQHLDGRDPFKPIHLIVPNNSLRQWLYFTLSREKGIAANIHFKNLDSAFNDLLAPEGYEILSEQALQMLVIRQLERYATSNRRELQSVAAYLNAGGDASLRLFQLSTRVTRLFREYLFAREKMVRAWERGRAWLDKNHPVEGWQRILWTDIFGEEGLLTAINADRPKTLAPLGKRFEEYQPKTTGDPLHIFGLSYISRFHQNILKAHSKKSEVYLYLLNPCMAFWEDLEGKRKKKGHAPLAIAPADENPLLQAWGRPGREYFRLLNALGNWDPHEHFKLPGGESPSLLHRVQTGILSRNRTGRREQEKQAPPLKADDSITILGCPGVRREAEIVVSHIWDLLIHHDYNPNQIAIIVTDMAAYQTEIESAFQRMHQLRYNLIDGQTGRATRLIAGVMLLLKLPTGGFRRDEVFALLSHPNFRARFPDSSPDTWLELIDRAGILFGWDQAAQKQQGAAYLEKDLYNWEQGFKRLLLGDYIEGQAVWNSGGQPYLAESLGESEGAVARDLMLLMRALHADTHDLALKRMKPVDWAGFLRTLVETYLAPDDREESAYTQILDSIAVLAELDEPAGDRRLNYELAIAFVESNLRRYSMTRGRYLADGITVSSFLPMRPIPFRALFIMGLNEGVFPTPPYSDTLDLRRYKREEGDVIDQERDKYMFLEALISTRERLFLSYEDRDEKTNDDKTPSTIIQELLHHLRHDMNVHLEIKRHPLKTYDARYFTANGREPLPNHDPFGRRLAAVRARKSMNPNPAVEALPADLREALGFNLLEPGPALDYERVQQLPLNRLRRFLECPLQATAARVLGLREQQGFDQEDQVEEPMGVDLLQRHHLLHESMAMALLSNQAADPLTAYAELTALEELAGRFPTGSMGRHAGAAHISVLETWLQHIQDLMGETDSRFIRYRLSHVREAAPDVAPPVTLQLQGPRPPKTVELVGDTQPLRIKGDSIETLSFVVGGLKEKHYLKGFLDALALTLAFPDKKVTCRFISGKPEDKLKKKEEPVRVLDFGLTPESARAYLTELVTSMLFEKHDYLMPIEAVARSFKALEKDGFQERYESEVRAALTGPFGCSSSYGPLTDLTPYAPHPDARPVIARRFKLVLEVSA